MHRSQRIYFTQLRSLKRCRSMIWSSVFREASEPSPCFLALGPCRCTREYPLWHLDECDQEDNQCLCRAHDPMDFPGLLLIGRQSYRPGRHNFCQQRQQHYQEQEKPCQLAGPLPAASPVQDSLNKACKSFGDNNLNPATLV